MEAPASLSPAVFLLLEGAGDFLSYILNKQSYHYQQPPIPVLSWLFFSFTFAFIFLISFSLFLYFFFIFPQFVSSNFRRLFTSVFISTNGMVHFIRNLMINFQN